jgi:hypothetical protein
LRRYHFIKRYYRVTIAVTITSAGFPLGP